GESMRLSYFGERSYVARIIRETRVLVNSNHLLHTKVALLESAIAEETHRIEEIERQLPGPDPARQERLRRILELRRRALGHYRCTVKGLLLREQRSMAMRRLPSFLGGGSPLSDRAREAPAPGDHPFMEFSS